MIQTSLTEELLTEFGFLKKQKAKALAQKYADHFEQMSDEDKKYCKDNAPDFFAAIVFRFYKANYENYAIPTEDAKFIDDNLDNYWSKFMLNRFSADLPMSVLSLRPNDMRMLAKDATLGPKYYETLFEVLKTSPETLFEKSPNDNNLTIAQKRILNSDLAGKGLLYNQTVEYYRARNQFEIDPRYDMSKTGKAPPPKPQPGAQPIQPNNQPPGKGKAGAAQNAPPPPSTPKMVFSNKIKDHDINKQNNRHLSDQIIDEIISDPALFFYGSEDDKRVAKNIVLKNIIPQLEKQSGFLEYFYDWLKTGHPKTRGQLDKMQDNLSNLMVKHRQ